MRMPNNPEELYEAVETGIYPADVEQSDWSAWKQMCGNKIVKPSSFQRLYIAHERWRAPQPIGRWQSLLLNYYLSVANEIKHKGGLWVLLQTMSRVFEIWIDGEEVPRSFDWKDPAY